MVWLLCVLVGAWLIVVFGLWWIGIKLGVLPRYSIKCPGCKRWQHIYGFEAFICERCNKLIEI